MRVAMVLGIAVVLLVALAVGVHGFGARGPLRTKVETGDGRFRIQLRAGKYVLTSTDGTGCSAAVVVILFKTTSANLQCGAP